MVRARGKGYSAVGKRGVSGNECYTALPTTTLTVLLPLLQFPTSVIALPLILFLPLLPLLPLPLTHLLIEVGIV